MKEWDSSKILHSTTEQIKASGRSSCVSGAATNLALCEKSVSDGLRNESVLNLLRVQARKEQL